MPWAFVGTLIAIAVTALTHIVISQRTLGKFEGVVTTRLDTHEKQIDDHESRLRVQEQRRFAGITGD